MMIASAPTGALIPTQCPVCLSSDFEHLTGLFRHPDAPEQFRRDPTRQIVACLACGTVQRAPLEVLAPAAVAEYGRSYYDQFADPAAWEAGVRAHIELQKLHYDQLRELLRSWTDPRVHRAWLDVGSAGCPTVFDDFDFQTVEPDPRVVALGRQLFAADKIHCGVLETFAPEKPLDGIVYHDSFYCVPSPNEALQKARLLLRPGGWLLFRMGGLFLQTRDHDDDGEYHRIEDAIRGDVKWVDYSVASLRVLCSRHGFAYVRDEEKVQHYSPHRWCRYILFEKAATPLAAPTIESVRFAHRGRLEELLNELRSRSEATLATLDQADVAILGSRALVADLRVLRRGFSPGALVDADFPDIQAPFTIDGARFIPMRDLAERLRAGDVRRLVLATFRNTRALAGLAIGGLPLDGARIYVPTRAAGEDRLLGDFRGGLTPLRALVLREAKIIGRPPLPRVERGKRLEIHPRSA